MAAVGLRLQHKIEVAGTDRMSDQVALDLFIQDFVNTNKLMNQHFDWNALVSRRWAEGSAPRIYEFQSGGQTQYARAGLIVLPDAEWYRIELTRVIPAVEEARFDYLRMLSATTHSQLTVAGGGGTGEPVYVRLLTRNRGLINVLFVIRDATGITNPYLA